MESTAPVAAGLHGRPQASFSLVTLPTSTHPQYLTASTCSSYDLSSSDRFCPNKGQSTLYESVCLSDFSNVASSAGNVAGSAGSG